MSKDNTDTLDTPDGSKQPTPKANAVNNHVDKPFVEVWERIYDNPLDDDGNKKPNTLLGNFWIVEKILDDMYSEQFIGLRSQDSQLYFVEGREVSFHNGGTRYTIKPLPELTSLIQVNDMLATNSKPSTGNSDASSESMLKEARIEELERMKKDLVFLGWGAEPLAASVQNRIKSLKEELNNG